MKILVARSILPNVQEPEPDMATILRHRKEQPKVVINVGGVKSEVRNPF